MTTRSGRHQPPVAGLHSRTGPPCLHAAVWPALQACTATPALLPAKKAELLCIKQ